MLLSFALVFLCGMALGGLFQKLHLPRLLGMLIAGIVLGPYALNMIDGGVLAISSDLRQIALIIILTRAGLSLDLAGLKEVGRPAILMCFVPACFEIAACMLLATKVFGLSLTEGAIMGAVIAAVSPAVIVPKMLMLMKEGYGQQIPQMIMAGASVDDVFVIVLFTSFTGLASGETLSAMRFIRIPTAIIIGLGVGIMCGIALWQLFKRVDMRNSAKVLIVLSSAFLLMALERCFAGEFSGLLAVMATGATLHHAAPDTARRLSQKYEKLWVAAEPLLFVLVGATVNIQYAQASAGPALIVIFGALLCRMLGVFVCVLRTKLNPSERVFCMIAYTPKATVQAAIGSIPLSMGLACGNIVLTVAVLSILITAPLGAFAIDLTYHRLLRHTIK